MGWGDTALAALSREAWHRRRRRLPVVAVCGSCLGTRYPDEDMAMLGGQDGQILLGIYARRETRACTASSPCRRLRSRIGGGPALARQGPRRGGRGPCARPAEVPGSPDLGVGLERELTQLPPPAASVSCSPARPVAGAAGTRHGGHCRADRSPRLRTFATARGWQNGGVLARTSALRLPDLTPGSPLPVPPCPACIGPGNDTENFTSFKTLDSTPKEAPNVLQE